MRQTVVDGSKLIHCVNHACASNGGTNASALAEGAASSSARSLGLRMSADMTATPTIEWPKARDVGRFGDMSPTGHIRVGLDSDNDAYVSIWDEEGGGSIEFCCPGAGGGKSSRTRLALIALMVAMEADNAETPNLDWWKRGMPGTRLGDFV
ncbi:hypothetical protein [Acidovorax sp.]|uniref:hypothetical protein n=1 Tax=Acidovorax sp. TaxID=1872122 RepID=UPI00391F8914